MSILCRHRPVAVAVEYAHCISEKGYDPHSTSVLDMTLNHLMVRPQFASENVEYPFIAITPRFTLTRSGNTCKVPTYGSNRTL